jgi:hypothetical protein
LLLLHLLVMLLLGHDSASLTAPTGKSAFAGFPVLIMSPELGPVAAKLAEAREIFQPLEPKSGSSGWGTHVRKVCLAVYPIAPQRGHCLQDRCTLVMYTLSAVLIKAWQSGKHRRCRT